MEDTIKRSDVTEAFAELYDIFDDYPNIIKELDKVYDKILAIPSAEPTIEIDAHQLAKLLREGWTIHSELKQGEWVSLHNGKWKCSECGIEVLIYAKGNFCPNCGARMKGADNDAD